MTPDPTKTPERRLRCGDTAHISGTDYDIEVAYADYQTGSASWCGWPDGTVDIDRVLLVAPCSDEEHRAAVVRWLDRERGSNHDHRRDTIERLYRPRAYWRGVIARDQAQLEQAKAALHGAELGLQEAEKGPEDV